MTARSRGAGATARPLTFTERTLAPLLWAALGALLIAALSQIPVRHAVDVGGWDAAYVQGFHEPEPAGAGRWSRASSALLFPQAGLPGLVELRLRGPADAPPVDLSVLLNGRAELARLSLGADATTLSLPVDGGLLKATDFFIELRAAPTMLPDGREVGVLLASATYTVGPGLVRPYPSQLLYGALVGALLWALLRQGRGGTGAQGLTPAANKPPPAARFAGLTASHPLAPLPYLLLYGLIWLLLYRLEPPFYPHPLRSLPLWAVGGLAALLALRDGPALAARRPWLLGAPAAAAVIGAWTAATLLLARGHVTLARPGVENDFRVFATRETLGQVFSADGFYNLGYPLLLWLVRPLVGGNAFLAGRLVAALAGAVLLAGGYWLARALLPRGPALLALLTLALSGLVAQYGLYLGSDMPFAAGMGLCVAALAAGLRAPAEGARRVVLAGLAGLCGGLAFLMRHPGLLLLPWGLGALLLVGGAGRKGWRAPAAYGLAFLLATAPQLAINLAQTGQPLYSQQAKNIWLAVYGGTDWGRWEEAPNTVGLAEVVLRDPGRFLGNWWRNVVAYLGSGAEDTGEFGRAMQLRLLGFPANWLAAGGLLAWIWALLRGRRRADDGRASIVAALLALVALYVAAVSSAFTLQRFFLPLAPIYAAAAGWMLWRAAGGGRVLAGASLALVVVLWGGFSAGASYVLLSQPPDEVAAITMVRAVAPEAPIAARVPARLPLAKYSVLAHQVIDWPEGAESAGVPTPAALDAARARGASYLLWDEAAGPPPLPDPAAVRVASSGRYGLYRLP